MAMMRSQWMKQLLLVTIQRCSAPCCEKRVRAARRHFDRLDPTAISISAHTAGKNIRGYAAIPARSPAGIAIAATTRLSCWSYARYFLGPPSDAQSARSPGGLFKRRLRCRGFSITVPSERVAQLPRPLALSLESTATEEIAKGSIQVAQRFLRRAFGDVIHPGDIGLFKHIELAVQILRCGTSLGHFIAFLLERQSPVVGLSGGTGMLPAGGHLPIVQGQFGFVGALHEHPIPPENDLGSRQDVMCARFSHYSFSRTNVPCRHVNVKRKRRVQKRTHGQSSCIEGVTRSWAGYE